MIVRGNHREKTFRDHRDYQEYLERLGNYRKRMDATVYAYCLMPNHVHLLVETGAQPLSRFMQGLQQSYTQYFNRRYRKVGHLFQGRYKAIVCDKDQYLLTLIRYIHLNPFRAKLVRNVDDYRYSGQRHYAQGELNELVEPSRVLDMLGGRAGYRRFIQQGMKEGHRQEYYQVEDQRFLGGDGFGEKLKTKAKEDKIGKPKRPLIVALRNAARELGIDIPRLEGRDRSWTISRARALIGYALIRQSGYPLKEVAKALGRDPATLSSLTSRLAERLNEDEDMRRQAEKIAEIV